MKKIIKKIIGLNSNHAKEDKDDKTPGSLPSNKEPISYVDKRKYTTNVYAPDSVFTHPHIGTSNPNESSKSPIEKDYTNNPERKNEVKPPIKSIKEKNSCNPSCPCWNKPFGKPKVCPICGHVFKGNRWEGIDAHYKANHEKENGIDYDEWWGKMCEDHKGDK